MVKGEFINWVDGLGLPGSQFRMLIAVKCAEQFQEDFPSLGEFSDHCKLHPNTVSSALKALVKKGFLDKQIRDGYSNVYTVTDPDIRKNYKVT
jgi:DNA-binding transcriptional regulator YhcF (GntR family)